MRIIQGTHRGRRISVPAGFKLRPTTDIAKESIFNVLNNYYDFDNISVLDLFAGTGSISYEFLSRGCTELLAIEKNPKHADFISRTAESLGFENFRILKADVFEFIKAGGKQYDLIFADPPFDIDNYEAIPQFIFQSELLTDVGTLVLEHPPTVAFTDFDFFHEQRNYGKVQFSIFMYPD